MANKKLTTCKACSAEVAKSAKACPHCGAKVKKGNPILTGIVIFLVLALIAGSSGGSDEPQKVEQPQSGTSAIQVQVPTVAPIEKNEFYVGETAELKGINVTFVAATENTGSAYNKPTDGNVFVLCEFEIANNSEKEITISSMMSFEAYCDDYTCNFSLTALMEKGNKNQLDGTVAPGKKFNGVIGYEVPADWHQLEINFTPDFWSGKDITFIAISE